MGHTTYVTVFAAVGSITYGYAAAIIGQVIGQPQFYTYFGLAQSGAGVSHTETVIGKFKEVSSVPETRLTSQGAMNGLYFAGGALGSLFSAWTGSAFGRLRTIQIACGICVLGAILMTAAVNVAMFLASRFIVSHSSRDLHFSLPSA